MNILESNQFLKKVLVDDFVNNPNELVIESFQDYTEKDPCSGYSVSFTLRDLIESQVTTTLYLYHYRQTNKENENIDEYLDSVHLDTLMRLSQANNILVHPQDWINHKVLVDIDDIVNYSPSLRFSMLPIGEIATSNQTAVLCTSKFLDFDFKIRMNVFDNKDSDLVFDIIQFVCDKLMKYDKR
jgi:hypothetical protein